MRSLRRGRGFWVNWDLDLVVYGQAHCRWEVLHDVTGGSTNAYNACSTIVSLALCDPALQAANTWPEGGGRKCINHTPTNEPGMHCQARCAQGIPPDIQTYSQC